VLVGEEKPFHNTPVLFQTASSAHNTFKRQYCGATRGACYSRKIYQIREEHMPKFCPLPKVEERELASQEFKYTETKPFTNHTELILFAVLIDSK
jgi:hypothetical protein